MWGRLIPGSALFLGDRRLDLLAHWSVRLGIRSTIDDCTIKPIEQHSFLLAGVTGTLYPSPRMGTAFSTRKGGRTHIDTMHNRTQGAKILQSLYDKYM
jgi:hypothetical protein